MKKKCSMCQEEKNVDQFNRDRRNKTDGLVARCKSCCKEIAASYYSENKDKVKAKVIEYRARVSGGKDEE